MLEFPLFSAIFRQIGPISLLFSTILLTTSSGSAIPPSDDVELRNVFHQKDRCFNESFVWIPEQLAQRHEDEELRKEFTVLTGTKQCADLLRAADLPSELPNCPPGLVDLNILPFYISAQQISHPYANWNISVTAHSSVETIAFRLECFSAVDGSDVYCSDERKMYFNNIKEWPCRAMTISKNVKMPVRFGYSCFRLTPLSTYAINATILPQKCRLSTVITSPTFTSMFPDELVIPKHAADPKSDPMWAPTVAAEMSDDSGIWIHLGKTEKARCDVMVVYVYRESANNSNHVHFVEKLEIKCPETSVKWENMVAGRYVLTAYVPIRGCKYHCEPDSHAPCLLCLRTNLNLFVPENRASMTWLAVHMFDDYSYEIFIVVICVFIVFCLSFCSYVGVIAYRQHKAANTVQEIQLETFVRPMLIYSDDTVTHREVVANLSECLRYCATCDPVYDMEKLITIDSVIPSRWLVDQLSSLKKFIIVMSECTVKLLDTEACKTHHLVTARPFADLFGPAMEIIIRDATQNQSEARKKYCIVKVDYSPEVPANLAILHFPVFNLPTDFGKLTAFLHDMENYEQLNIAQNLTADRLQRFEHLIAVHKCYMERHPGWIKRRWRVREDPVIPMIPLQEARFEIVTDEDRIKASKMYGVDPPREESVHDEDEEQAEEEQEGEQEDEESKTVTVKEGEREFLLRPPEHVDSDEHESSSESEEDSDENHTIQEFRQENLF